MTTKMHIDLGEELSTHLELFAANREKSKSKIIRYALKLLFSLERIDAAKDEKLKTIISRKFNPPSDIPMRSFYLFLYMLSKNYPNQSSKAFWGELVYGSSLEKTHKDIFTEINDEYSIHTNGKLSEHAKFA